ncbi:MAG: TadE/TadG family type IV pilus assembly protein [Candidatus Korobacteraceae bacterium]
MTIENGLRKIGNLFGQRGEEGSALVEFALTLPMLFGLIYLSASLTLGMYNLQQLGNATSATAMAVGSDAGLFPGNDPCAYAKSTMLASLPTWTAGNFSYTLTITDTSDATHKYTGTGTSFSCSSAPAMGPNYPVTLTVTYTYAWLGIPAMPFFNAGTKTAGSLASSESAIQM